MQLICSSKYSTSNNNNTSNNSCNNNNTFIHPNISVEVLLL